MAKDVLTAVRATSPLTVEVADLLRRPGASRPLRFQAAVEGLRLALAQVVQGSELGFDLHLDALVDGIHVRGVVRADVDLECARCLRAFRSHIDVEIDGLYISPGGLDDEELSVIEDERIDLEPVVRDSVLLAMPLNPVCRESCLGLCSACGEDRNETACGHGAEKVDIRLEALQRLRERMED